MSRGDRLGGTVATVHASWAVATAAAAIATRPACAAAAVAPWRDARAEGGTPPAASVLDAVTAMSLLADRLAVTGR